MSDLDDDDIDKLLLAQFEGPVPDDGFCDAAMQRLPARRRRHPWPSALGIAMGGISCWASLNAAPLLRAGWRDWSSGAPSAPAFVVLAAMAGLAFLALAWTIAEADASQ